MVREMGDGVVFLEKYGKPYIEITDDGRCYIKMWKDGKYYICECGSSKCRIYVPIVNENCRINYVEYS